MSKIFYYIKKRHCLFTISSAYLLFRWLAFNRQIETWEIFQNTANFLSVIINYIIITACSYACESCTSNTVSSCTACYGSSGQNSSRILPACTCPLLGFWDNYPYQSECQACANIRCLSCNNSNSICTACVGTISNSFTGSRTLPNCGCPNGYYDNAMYSDCQTCAA